MPGAELLIKILTAAAVAIVKDLAPEAVRKSYYSLKNLVSQLSGYSPFVDKAFPARESDLQSEELIEAQASLRDALASAAPDKMAEAVREAEALYYIVGGLPQASTIVKLADAIISKTGNFVVTNIGGKSDVDASRSKVEGKVDIRDRACPSVTTPRLMKGDLSGVVVQTSVDLSGSIVYKDVIVKTWIDKLVVKSTTERELRWQLAAKLDEQLIEQLIHIDHTYEEMKDRMRPVIGFLLDGWQERGCLDSIVDKFSREGISPAKILNELKRRLSEAKSSLDVAKIEYHTGLYFEARVNDPVALTHYDRAASVAPEVSDYFFAAGRLALKLGSAIHAERIFADAYKKLPDDAGVELRVRVLNGQASAFFERGCFEEAHDIYIGIAYYAWDESLDAKLRAVILNNSGWIDVVAGDIASGMRFLAEALRLKEELDDPPASRALTMCNLAGAYSRCNENAAALKLLSDAERLLRREYDRKFPNHPALGRIYNQIGMLFYSGKNFTEALAMYQKGFDILHVHFDDCNIQKVLSLHNQAMAGYYAGDKSAAKRIKDRVRIILEQCPNLPEALVTAIEEDYRVAE